MKRNPPCPGGTGEASWNRITYQRQVTPQFQVAAPQRWDEDGQNPLVYTHGRGGKA